MTDTRESATDAPEPSDPTAEAAPPLEDAAAGFAAHVLHELRTAATLLLDPIDGILRSPASALAPSSRVMLDGARRSALRLLQLVDAVPQVWSTGRGPAGGGAGEDLGAFTATLAETFRPACDAAGIRLVVDSPRAAGHPAVDPGLWETIVVNVLANAFNATVEGAIEVRLRVDDRDAVLVVIDTSADAAPRERPNAFEHADGPSFAGASGSTRAVVGLPLVRELLQRCGGSIDVQRGRSGATTTVRVALAQAAPAPVRRNSSQSAHAAGPHASPPVASRGHVVVAEDHAETREYLCAALTAAGFTVDGVIDGRAALEACRQRAPDAVVSDVLMPGLSGFELIEKLRVDERTAATPVLLLSARGGEDSRIEGIAAGADGYLEKPLSRRELVARVDGAVRLARLRRDTARREDERFRELSIRLVDVQEDERRQLSADLHDRTSPQLAAIQINLNMLGTLLGPRASDDVKALVDDTIHLLSETTTSIREISSNLRPSVLDDGGLRPALAAYAQQFAQRTGIRVHTDCDEAADALAPATQSSLFRIAQEALTNCAKHAKAQHVTIQLRTGGGAASLVIADDGVGFDPGRRSGSGLGLVTMRQRAEFLGGRFDLDAAPGKGTRIAVVV